jgi:hypothetical protein
VNDGTGHRAPQVISDIESKTMNIVVGTLAAFLFSGVLSSEAQARCWCFGRLSA